MFYLRGLNFTIGVVGAGCLLLILFEPTGHFFGGCSMNSSSLYLIMNIYITVINIIIIIVGILLFWGKMVI